MNILGNLVNDSVGLPAINNNTASMSRFSKNLQNEEDFEENRQSQYHHKVT